MSTSAGAVVLNLGLDTSGFESTLNGVKKKTEGALSTSTTSKFTNSLKNSSSAVSGLSSVLGKLGGAVAVAFSVKKIVEFSSKCIEIGSSLNEVQNVVNTAFPTMTKQIENWSQTASSQFGLSELQAKQFSSTLGTMAQSFGFTESQAATMSTTLAGLAGDVASFYDMSQEEAFSKLKSVFTGETESLKQLGVVMTQSALDQFALEQGFGKTTSKMTEQEKAALRYQFVLSNLSKANGDFAKTSDSWANSLRSVKNHLSSIMGSLGQILIKLLNPALNILNRILAVVDKLMSKFKDDIIGDDITDALYDASDITDELSLDFSNASDEINSATESAKELQKTLFGFDKINKLSDTSTTSASGADNITNITNITNVGGNSSSSSSSVVNSIGDFGTGTAGSAGNAVSNASTDAEDKAEKTATKIKKFLDEADKNIAETMAPVWEKLKGDAEEYWRYCEEILFNAVPWIYNNIIAPVADWVDEKISLAWEKLKEIFGPAVDWFKDYIITPVSNWFNDKFGGVIDKIKEKLASIKSWFSDTAVGQAVNYIKNGQTGSLTRSVSENGGFLSLFKSGITSHANGGYFPANAPHLAIVGDNKSQSEYVLNQGQLNGVIAQASSSGNSEVVALLSQILTELANKNMSVELDGQQITKTVWKNTKNAIRASGNNPMLA